jgi:hypothetical protein
LGGSCNGCRRPCHLRQHGHLLCWGSRISAAGRFSYCHRDPNSINHTHCRPSDADRDANFGAIGCANFDAISDPDLADTAAPYPGNDHDAECADELPMHDLRERSTTRDGEQ